MNEPYIKLPRQEILSRVEQPDQQQLHSAVLQELIQQFQVEANAQIAKASALEIEAQGAQLAARIAPPIAPTLMITVITLLCYSNKPKTLLVAFCAGNLLTAWSPAADKALGGYGELVVDLMRIYLHRDCSDKILTYLLAFYPSLWFLSMVPGLGWITSWVGAGYATAVGLGLGRYIWHQQLETWQERQAQEIQPANLDGWISGAVDHIVPGWARLVDADGTPPTLFQVRALAEWIDEYVGRRFSRTGALYGQWQAWCQNHHLGTLPNLIAEVADQTANWRRTSDFVERFPLEATSIRLLIAGGLGGWLAVSSSPHIFAASTTLAAYLCATSEIVGGITDSPAVRAVPVGALAIFVSLPYFLGTIITWGFATGLATASYWCGPFNFSSYQVLSLAYTATLWEYLISGSLGIIVGHQLWNTSRLLYQERMDTEAQAPDELPWISQRIVTFVSSTWRLINATRQARFKQIHEWLT